MNATSTNLKTADGLTIYDLDPQASELWAVAGPAGLDPAAIDPDNLPEGCRWVEADEWALAMAMAMDTVDLDRLYEASEALGKAQALIVGALDLLEGCKGLGGERRSVRAVNDRLFKVRDSLHRRRISPPGKKVAVPKALLGTNFRRMRFAVVEDDGRVRGEAATLAAAADLANEIFPDASIWRQTSGGESWVEEWGWRKGGAS